MKSEIISKQGMVVCCAAILISSLGLSRTADGGLVSLSHAGRFLFLTPTRIHEGGGCNSYTGDIGTPYIISWNPASFTGASVSNQATLNTAVADAMEFSQRLMQLPADVEMKSGVPNQWSTVKTGLNVVYVFDDPAHPYGTILPQTVIGSSEDTVVFNVLASGKVVGSIQVSGGLLPENLIINYVNASEVWLGLGSRRSAGTYLIASSSARYSAGSGGLDGAVIAAGDIDISGGSNSFTYHPFDSSAIPEPATVLLLGLGGLTILRKRRG